MILCVKWCIALCSSEDIWLGVEYRYSYQWNKIFRDWNGPAPFSKVYLPFASYNEHGSMAYLNMQGQVVTTSDADVKKHYICEMNKVSGKYCFQILISGHCMTKISFMILDYAMFANSSLRWRWYILSPNCSCVTEFCLVMNELCCWNFFMNPFVLWLDSMTQSLRAQGSHVKDHNFEYRSSQSIESIFVTTEPDGWYQ